MPLADEFKVVGIGFNKTGTTTLRRCLQILGIGPHPDRFAMNEAGIVRAMLHDNDPEPALRFAANYRGFEDRPWNTGTLYQRFARRYPGTRFILTIRDGSSWWESVVRGRKTGKDSTIAWPFRRYLDVDEFTREKYIVAYESFNRQIIEYFAAHPEEHFLIMNFKDGDGWEKLCEFLGKPEPRMPFPHMNRREESSTVRSKFREKLPSPVRKVISRLKTRLQNCVYAFRRW